MPRVEWMNVCVIGAGTYGSYIVNSLQERYPDIRIVLFDVGDSKIRSEEEVGYYSSLKKELYTGLTDGRWFGFGGTSTKWGGGLLTFTPNDFANASPFMRDIVELGEKYKKSMLKKFDIENNYGEKSVAAGLFTKTGIWLSFFKRDFFKHFKIKRRRNVTIKANVRVTRLESVEGKTITKVFYKEKGVEKKTAFDFYFLAAGAFESARILLNSKLLPSEKVMFSDHLSQNVFKIREGTKIGKEDFVFKVTGTSLVTKRLIGEIDNISFYAHPVLNTDFPFFQSLKTLLFKREFSIKAIRDLFLDLPRAVAFVYSALIKREMYVLNGEWNLYIDIENPSKDSYVSLSDEHDKFGEPGLDVYYSIGEKSQEIYRKSKELVKQYLIDNNVIFEECFETISVKTSEDIYHPFGMYCHYNSKDDYYKKYGNMLVVSTGVLPRAGGINPTAAVLPLIDDFICNYLQKSY